MTFHQCRLILETETKSRFHYLCPEVSDIIVLVWSQYDGANIGQYTIGYGWRQNQEAKLKIVGGD